MFAGSLVLGITVLGFAIWLQYNDTHGWPNEKFETELDNQYLARRKRSRKRIHVIIGACGVLILIAGVHWMLDQINRSVLDKVSTS